MRKEIRIKNQVGELDHVARFIEEICDELGLDMELKMNLNLVMEEMVSNVIFYALFLGSPPPAHLPEVRSLGLSYFQCFSCERYPSN